MADAVVDRRDAWARAGRAVSHSRRLAPNMETYFQNMSVEEGSKEKLIRDLNVLMHDAEELIKAAGHDLSVKSKDHLMAALERFKTSCRRVEAEAASAARVTDRLVRAHPYEAVGVAFGVGLLIGVLLGRD